MHDDRIALLATAIVLGTGVLWGFYWLPIRALSDMGLAGAWGTLVITVAAVVILSPLAIVRWRQFIKSGPLAVASVALGGAAFALYSVGLVYGRVAIIILLYFLTPVWSTLIGRYVMGWHTPRLRIVAIAVGLAGLAVMLSAKGDLPLPQGKGEWMSLIAGIMWSVATTGIRARPDLKPVEAAFVFALGATLPVMLLAPYLEPWPTGLLAGNRMLALSVAFLTGAFWWVLSIASLMWATARLDPARVGILMMTEVIVGAASAAILANEHLERLEIVGGLLVVCAGVLEVWPTRRAPSAHAK
jgi:drug/metabolite transporter (DMT)-like permease